MPADVVHCRLPATTLQKLDARVDLLRRRGINRRLASRSSVIRTILTEYLDADATAAREFEVLEHVQNLVQRAMHTELQRRLQALPQAMGEAATAAVLSDLTTLAQGVLRKAFGQTAAGMSMPELVAAALEVEPTETVDPN